MKLEVIALVGRLGEECAEGPVRADASSSKGRRSPPASLNSRTQERDC